MIKHANNFNCEKLSKLIKPANYAKSQIAQKLMKIDKTRKTRKALNLRKHSVIRYDSRNLEFARFINLHNFMNYAGFVTCVFYNPRS